MKLSQLVEKAETMLSPVNKIRTILAYRTVKNCVLSLTRDDPELKEVFCVEFIFKFEEYLRSKGKKRNTISFYMRMLRSLYNKAVTLNYYNRTSNLFAYVFTGLDPTIKRAVAPDIVYRIEHADLSDSPALEFARDLFMLCLHTQGMTFVDLAYLKRSDIQHGVISYRRKKTNAYVCIPVNKKAKKIIAKYAPLAMYTQYVFPACLSRRKKVAPREIHDGYLAPP